MDLKNRSKQQKIVLDGLSLTIDQILEISRNLARVSLSKEALDSVENGRKVVERIIKSGKTAYGVNTGFGKLSEKKIDLKDLEALQLNLIRSHAAGVGDPLSAEEVRAIMVVRLNTLLRGYSGVRKKVVEQLVNYLNSNLVPEIPRYGSLGASGDLAPSAHLALAMVGEGNVVSEGHRKPIKDLLRAEGLNPIKLKEKEGLAIINGTQMMSALGSLLVRDATNFFDNLDIAAAVSLEALGCNLGPFDSRIHELRPIKGQAEVAARIRQIVSGSKLLGQGKRVQDPYSVRCIPQVHGAFREALRFSRSLLETEINSVTDNPIIFPDETVISAGNFHGQPISVAMDLMGVVLAEASAYSERRTDKLLSGFNSKLPLFLINGSGLYSGMMILQYTAAALANQNVVLATPAGLHSADVSAGQEDHASMGVTSVLKAREILRNATRVIAIELICGCQALDFLLPEKLGAGTLQAFWKIRKLTKRVERDRALSEDIERLSSYLESGEFAKSVFRAAKEFIA